MHVPSAVDVFALNAFTGGMQASAVTVRSESVH
jgi:hypothetical protein